MRTRASAITSVFILLAVLAGPVFSRADPTPTSKLRFTATADAYVNRSKPTRNYGSALALKVGVGPRVLTSYVRFDLSGVSGTVTRATLRIHAESKNRRGYDVHSVADGTWAESTITAANAPPPGPVVGSSGAHRAGTWTKVDVTALVSGDGAFNLALTSRSQKVRRYSSRETSTPPKLVVKQPSFPIRAAFYYPWFPEAWTQLGIYPYTNYTPTPGYYDASDVSVVQMQIDAMQYGGIQAGIASWWGKGTRTDARIPTLLQAAANSPFRWTIYYEREGQGDPAVKDITSDLVYVRGHYGSDPSYLRIGGRFVVFVYADAADSDNVCAMASRWKQANQSVGAYLVLKVGSGYRDCADQPDAWHQYGPAIAQSSQPPWSYSISPGFWKIGETPRLTRDAIRWNSNIQNMIASGAQFQLVTTFNEWGEGTAVESALEWASPSGYGTYLDALHDNGGGLDLRPRDPARYHREPATSR